MHLTSFEHADEASESSRFWIAPVRRAWYVICQSEELTRRPLSRRLFDVPIVLFRTRDNRIGALVDRCPHRNVPLSAGRVVDCQIECPYHGWQFDCEGTRVNVPGLCPQPEPRRHLASRLATREQDGFVWVYGTPDVEPDAEPFRVPSKEGYTTVRRYYDIECTLFASVENALDVPHSAFLHRGLFRGAGQPQRIKAVITRGVDRVEAEYIGEQPPKGLAARLLTRSGDVMTHSDRFILPSITQVEYRLGDKGHLTTFFCTPVKDFSTRIFGAFQFRLGLPSWLMVRVMTPVIKRIILQDVKMLKEQGATIAAFGEECYTSTPLDLLGLQIWRLMRRAAAAAPPDPADAAWRREIDLVI